ncbi:hypothetical protein [Alteromonas sp. KUL49]|uniref:hypothetical protein n=1 Tax=Alteromonas sp. KUL49 TaxID=2480798 RepID=UPI00102EFA5B|nr:hypothetical protein [Alteromonas sp. KUL49]TAP40922.1 hypothetical protein EYS00_07390 [Alteromonas sp. KUL49]GEA11103.1 hypothetical protein KUL49_14780 [Alteromonas sp. KUL49]
MFSTFKNGVALGMGLMAGLLLCGVIITIILSSLTFDNDGIYVPGEHATGITFNNTFFEQVGDQFIVDTLVKNSAVADYTKLMLKFSFLDSQSKHIFDCEYQSNNVFAAESSTQLNHTCFAVGAVGDTVESVSISVKWGEMRVKG